MQKAHRARQRHLARADAHHFAAHARADWRSAARAAQPRQSMTTSPVARAFRRPRQTRIVAALRAQALSEGAQSRRADRDGLRRRRTDPLRKRPARSGSSAAMRASSDAPHATARARARSGRSRQRRAAAATTSVPSRARRARARPTSRSRLGRARRRSAGALSPSQNGASMPPAQPRRIAAELARRARRA